MSKITRKLLLQKYDSMNPQTIKVTFICALVIEIILGGNAIGQTATDVSVIRPVFTSSSSHHHYRNPVVDFDFPDPNLVLAKDGYIYAYSTQATYNRPGMQGLHLLPILRTKDLVHWDYAGDVFKTKPTWKQPGGLWAPDVSFFKDRYLLYYSCSVWGDPNPGIGVAWSQQPQGPFTDEGKLFLSKEIGVDNSIDPVFYLDKDQPYLFWGSFRGIFGVALSPNGFKTAGEKFQIAGNSFEGSFIFKRGRYYYYFGSKGTCCEGLKSTYRIVVGRADSLRGPYVDHEGKRLLDNGGSLVIQKNADSTGFTGPGHNGDLIVDQKGDTWFIYHAYKDKEPSKGRVMLMDKLLWKDNWPQVKNFQPSTKRQRGPVL